MNELFKIFVKSFISTVCIGYMLYSFIYIVNNDFCTEGNILDTSCYRYNPHAIGKNVIDDQPKIFSSYKKWLNNALYLDFGIISNTNPKKVFIVAKEGFITSVKLIFFSISISLFLSLLIHTFSSNTKIRNRILDPFLSFSLLHVIIFAILYKSYIDSGDTSVLSDVIVCTIIAFSSGMLFDYYSLLKNEHDNIIKKDYVIFAYNSGYNQYVFALKEIIISMIYITISRIPILFAGMTIIEILSKGKYNGIGYIIWYYVNKSEPYNYSIFFGSTMLTIFIFIFFYFMSEHLKGKLSPKTNKT